jgi:hypothetical protein
MPDTIPPVAPVVAPVAVAPEVILEPTDHAIASKVLKSFNDLMAPEPAKPAEPVKPAEPAAKLGDAPDPLDNPVGLSPKASEQFKHIKATRDEWRTKAKSYEDEKTKLLAELDALKKAPAAPAADPAELESLRKQVKEYDEQLRLTAIERHPKFKAHFDNAMEQANKLAAESVGKDYSGKLAAILKMPDGETRNEQLESLSANLTPLQQGKLAAALVEVQKVERERESELTKARDNYDRVVAHEKAQTEQKTAAQKSMDNARLAKSLELAKTIPAFKPADNDATGVERVKQYEQIVRAYHAGRLPEDMQAALPVMAMTALHQKTVQIPALEAEIAKRDAIIASYTKSSPQASGGSTKPAAQDGEPLPEGNKFLAAFQRNNPAGKR